MPSHPGDGRGKTKKRQTQQGWDDPPICDPSSTAVQIMASEKSLYREVDE